MTTPSILPHLPRALMLTGAAAALGMALLTQPTRATLPEHAAEPASFLNLTESDLQAAWRQAADPEQRQRQLTVFIAKEWRLRLSYAETVVRTAFRAGDRYSLDPVLLLAMAARESSFRHVGNPDGGADPEQPFGIMQVAGRWHREKFAEGVVRPTTVTENIDLGAQVIREYLNRERGDEMRALLRYNGALNLPEPTYSIEVAALKQKLMKAADPESFAG